MVQQTEYENKNGVASQWIANKSYRRVFYTIEFFDSSYIDLYEDEKAWQEAFEAGVNNNSRIASLPNVFINGNEAPFFIICSIFAVCGSLKNAVESFYDVFEMDSEGFITPCCLYQKDNNTKHDF